MAWRWVSSFFSPIFTCVEVWEGSCIQLCATRLSPPTVEASLLPSLLVLWPTRREAPPPHRPESNQTNVIAQQPSIVAPPTSQGTRPLAQLCLFFSPQRFFFSSSLCHIQSQHIHSHTPDGYHTRFNSRFPPSTPFKQQIRSVCVEAFFRREDTHLTPTVP